MAFGQLILAEYELLQHSEPAEPEKPKLNRVQEGDDEGTPKGGKGKYGKGAPSSETGKGSKGGSPPNASGSSSKEYARAVCKYWCITDMGCTKAAKCPDVHNKDLLKGLADVGSALVLSTRSRTALGLIRKALMRLLTRVKGEKLSQNPRSRLPRRRKRNQV